MVVPTAYPVQLIQPDGRRVLDTEYGPLVADVGPDELRGLYRDMVVARRIDAEATALQRQGELGLWAPLQGQEAAQVAPPGHSRPTTTSSPATVSTPSRCAAVSIPPT